MPPIANIGVLDDGSPSLGEVMNLLSRRNLLYRVVTKPDSSLDLNVKVGVGAVPRRGGEKSERVCGSGS